MHPLYYSLKRPFLSKPLYSAHSIPFSKFARFELLICLSGMEFGRFSRMASDPASGTGPGNVPSFPREVVETALAHEQAYLRSDALEK